MKHTQVFQKYSKISTIAFISYFLFSCNDNTNSTSNTSVTDLFTTEKIDISSVNEFLNTLKDTNSTYSQVLFGDTLRFQKELISMYAKTDNTAIWLNKGGVSKNTIAFLEVLNSLKYEGIDINKYHLDSLQQIVKNINTGTLSKELLQLAEMQFAHTFLRTTHDVQFGAINPRLIFEDYKNKNDSIFKAIDLLPIALSNHNFEALYDSLKPRHPWYNKFVSAYKKLDSIKISGGWQTINNLKDSMANGFSSSSIPLLRKRLQKELGIPQELEKNTWDQDLAIAVQTFQQVHNLKITGNLDTTTLNKLNTSVDDKLKKLAINMERMRWLKQDFPQPYIMVNIPKMELDYIEKDSIKWNMKVVVGRTSRPTPTLDSKVENIVFNPPWTVPPTIMKEEVVPGILRRGGSYLARRGLKAYRNGRPVNPALINKSNYKSFAISQNPGYNSSLGCVKFNMPNPWSIYMHDTPHREDFVRSYRAYSSGCIRVHKPKEFAEFMLQDTSYTKIKIDSIVKTKNTIFVPMKRNVDVHVVYLTNAIDSAGNVTYLNDIYKLDGKVK
jgi:murein L,D-transpeptidase YcbB/YkuD